MIKAGKSNISVEMRFNEVRKALPDRNLQAYLHLAQIREEYNKVKELATKYVELCEAFKKLLSTDISVLDQIK